MQMSQSQSYSKRVKFGSLFRKLSFLPKMHKQLTTSDKFHYEEYFGISLKYVLHTNKEWMISLLQNILLQKCGFNLFIIENYILSE